jgi:hypothetical protein
MTKSAARRRMGLRPEYLVRRAGLSAPRRWDWDRPPWDAAGVLHVNRFHARGSSHRPVTRAKVLYDARGLAVLFRVQDRYVRSVQTKPNSLVCTDSCVEFFARPKPGRGYINFEVNAGGALYCAFIRDWSRAPGGFKDYEFVVRRLTRKLEIVHSLPSVVEPEIAAPTTWTLGLFIPFALFERYLGRLGGVAGRSWRANFFKCGDETSHPHWAMWSPVKQLNFHQPGCFGYLRFGK